MAEENIYYSLATINMPNITGVRELSEESFEKYSKSITKLTQESLNESLYNIVELNYNELKESRKKHLAGYPSNLVDMYDFYKIFIDLNRLVLNLLSATRTYLDHTETRLQRVFGKQSNEFVEFKKLISEAFDSEFSYSFLEKLRNYAQHCGLPVGGVTVSSKADGKNDTINTLVLYLDRDELLEKFDWSPKKVKEELLKQEKEFDMLPLIDKKFEILKAINSKINGNYYLALKEEAEELLNLIIETEEVGGIPILLKMSGSRESPHLVKIEFPYKEIEKITNYKIDFNYILKTEK